MKACIYNPYLDTLGGGERYAMTFAKVLSENGFDVNVEWKNPKIKVDLEKRFGMDLSEINFIPDVKKGDGYDLCFWVSDGSVPLLHARNNILHFQVPFHDVDGKSMLNRMKFFRINKIVCNSNFTKKVIDQEYGVNSLVLYPPVDTAHIKKQKKDNLILSVARFSQLKQSKHQDILINAFKKLYDSGNREFKLVVAGGVEIGAGDYVARLKESSLGYPVEIIQSPDFSILKKLFGKAKFFWSASGFGEDEIRHPEKVEHFGITIVEAMSAGAIPLAFNAGGHREILGGSEAGYLWNTIGNLVKATEEINKNKSLYKKMSIIATQKSDNYCEEKFSKGVLSLAHT